MTPPSYRILFPLLGGEDKNLSRFGVQRIEGFSDPDDYLAIESGSSLSIFVCVTQYGFCVAMLSFPSGISPSSLPQQLC